MLLSFLLLWWNKELGGTTEGWFQHYADLLLGGRMPYRDFYLFTPPGHLLETALISKFFGTHFVFFRLAGLIQRLAMCLILYLWLVRFFHPLAAFVGSAFCLIIYSCDWPDVLFYAHHSTAFWSLLSCWLASKFNHQARHKYRWALAAGMAAGLNLCVKQTTGMGVTLLIPAAWLLTAWPTPFRKETAKSILCFATGWLLPLSAVYIWLSSHQAWGPFLDQVFLSGTSSKGSLADVLLRPFTPWSVLLIYVLLGFFIWRSSQQIRKASETLPTPASFKWSKSFLLLFFFTTFASIPLGYCLGKMLFERYGQNNTTLLVAANFLLIAGSFPGCAILAVRFCPIWASEKSDPGLFFLSLTGASMAMLYALSCPLYNPMVLPGLGLLTAYYLHHSLALSRCTIYGKWLLAALLSVIVVFTSCSTALRLLVPFGFFGWQEPSVFEERGKSKIPALAGMDISKPTSQAMDGMVRLIQEHSRPNGTLFVFPHFPILYTLSNRTPVTFSQVQWFDVCPDYVVQRDIATLFKSPPDVIVEMCLIPEDVDYVEGNYRGGKKSAQRLMIDTLSQLTKQYTLASEFKTPPFGRPIQVWVKNEQDKIR